MKATGTTKSNPLFCFWLMWQEFLDLKTSKLVQRLSG